MRRFRRASAVFISASLWASAFPLGALPAQVGPRAGGTRQAPLRVVIHNAPRTQGAAVETLKVSWGVSAVPQVIQGVTGPANASFQSSAPNVVWAKPGIRGIHLPPGASFSATREPSGQWANPGEGRGEGERAPLDDLAQASHEPQPATDETAKKLGLRVFDGGTARVAQPVEAPAESSNVFIRLARASGRTVGRLLPTFAKKFSSGKPAVPFDTDSYGGPEHKTMDLKGRLLYGLKWGINLAGISTLLQWTLKPLLTLIPWQIYASPDLLHKAGRVELLSRLGPKGIEEAIGQAPYQFLFYQLPVATFWEELSYRVLGFGLTFLALAAIRPASGWISKKLEALPDLFALRSLAQAGLAVASGISSHAFGLAAILSAYSFAASHFAAWGIGPYTLAVQLSLGIGLSYAAYRSRSLAVPYVAHLSYNILALLGTFLAVHLMMPVAAQAWELLLGVFSLAFVYYNYRSYRKARAAALGVAQTKAKWRGTLRAGVAGLVIAALAGLATIGGPSAHDTGVAAKKLGPVPGWAQNVKPQDAKIEPPSQEGTQAQPKAEEKLRSYAEITAKAKPSVVMIRIGRTGGTGFIVSKDGLLVTNAHVADAAGLGGQVTIVFSNGRALPAGSENAAKVVAINRDRDIALIQLPENPGGWPFLALADMSTVAEGDEVLAMGHPQGLPFTVTKGIVSGVGHRGNLYVQHIQTDADVNPGNSGGPLINNRGEVIGINTWIIGAAGMGAAGGSIGLNFAVSTQDLAAALAQFAATGNINSAWLGVIVDRTDPFAPEDGIKAEQVRPGSPASAGGLRPGDVILGADDRMLPDNPQALASLARAIALKKPGDTLKLLVARGEETVVLTFKLADKN